MVYATTFAGNHEPLPALITFADTQKQLHDLPLTFQELAMNESHPLSAIQLIVWAYLRERTDVAIFGAQAVNAYVDAPRMTQDVDIMATEAEMLANELAGHLHDVLNIAVRTRSVASGKGFRVYQVRKPTNRHLVDIRQVAKLPICQVNDGVLVVSPVELIALKVISMSARPNTPKGLTDHVDLMRLLLKFPEYKVIEGPVSESLQREDADERAIRVWRDLVAQDFRPDNDDEY